MHYSINKGNSLEDVPHDSNLIAMGINPSRAHLHQGHYLTLYHMLKLLHERKDTHSVVFVDNREFDCRKHIDDAEKKAPPLIVPPIDIVRKIDELIQGFIQKIADEIGDSSLPKRVKTISMSEYLTLDGKNTSNGFELFQLLWKFREDIKKEFLLSDRASKQCTFRPACNECGHATMKSSDVQITPEGLRGTCRNSACNIQEYSVDIFQREANWFINYVLDPLRDVQLADQNNSGVIHIFGGDYGAAWGTGGIPKAERLSRVIEKMNKGVVIHHYTGPMLTHQGEKLAKSNGDGSEPMTAKELEAILAKKSATVEMESAPSKTIVEVSNKPFAPTQEQNTYVFADEVLRQPEKMGKRARRVHQMQRLQRSVTSRAKDNENRKKDALLIRRKIARNLKEMRVL